VSRLYATLRDLTKNDRALAFTSTRGARRPRHLLRPDGPGRPGDPRPYGGDLTHPQGLDPGFRDRLLLYLKLFWINNGNHNDRTRQKFVPEFSFDELKIAAEQARRQGRASSWRSAKPLRRSSTSAAPIFDPQSTRSPLQVAPARGDILTCSSVNFQQT